ncbi:NADH-dependent [FeFe] hydrogenase, group A6 [Oscillibacter sp.]|uniref:NADH-dependent [FeFe] hydrogenase, group A6 n=1 Tax=Oscillibacter sp. TaxID=1945593 RepID=UPI0026269636|nr:NADH-dependent [FeFe] hydrogenase, group A6 [Oscillibacter sp.]MDD3347621.1 NADH-dependent [FeFe] hydrogenase, group A6 [Oscillibacter sp.]
MVKIKINNTPLRVAQGTTILDAAKELNIKIPTLCYHPDLCIAGSCRICVVEEKRARTLLASCCTPVAEGMEILTNTKKVRTARKHIIAMMLSEHAENCVHCFKNMNCELQSLSREYSVETQNLINICKPEELDISSPSIKKDFAKCIRCQRCVRTCADLQHVTALTAAHKGSEMKIATFLEKPLAEVVCTNCGQCVNRCPTGALTEQSYVEAVWNAINSPDKHVVVQTAPAVRVAIGEELGYDPGNRLTGKMVTALKRIGFNTVFDTDFTADLTIMEEGTELLTRLKKALKDKEPAPLPQYTSCSPGWIKYIEHEFPDQLEKVSTCKSPQQMFGALAKTYYAQKAEVDPKDIVVVSIMPCTAKKFEAGRPEMWSSGFRDVDYVLTTRELALMIEQTGIDFRNLEPSHFDSLMGMSTGAGVIFGATGGVMEAAIRTVYEIVTGREIPFKNLEVAPVRGMEGVKEASLKLEGCLPEWDFLEGVELRVAVAHGLVNARKVAKQVEAGNSPYHFIEIMACPGGCLGGGGQPIPTNCDIRLARAKAIYEEDESMELRKSHENPEVTMIYKDFLKEPLGHKSHKLLHTTYTKRKKY